MENSIKIFLGGTIGEKDWRQILIPFLEKYKIDYFNPVLPQEVDWTEEARINEEMQKKICNIHLYVITPEMKGIYSIAEAVQSSNSSENITIICFLNEYNGKRFSERLHNNFVSVGTLIVNNPETYVFFNIKDTIQKILEFI